MYTLLNIIHYGLIALCGIAFSLREYKNLRRELRDGKWPRRRWL